MEDAELVERVRRAAELAKLPWRPEFVEHIKRFLKFVESVLSVDVEGVEPFLYPVEGPTPLAPDEPGETLPRMEALRDAPDVLGAYFKVRSPRG